MTSIRRPVAIATMALALAACASEKTSAPTAATSSPVAPAAPVAGTIAEETVEVTATVEKIDQAKRLVTLRGPEGGVVTVEAGPQVKNLAQVKKGDLVKVAYYESLAYEVKEAGTAEPGRSVTDVAAGAKPGERPAGGAASEITVTTTIEAIDKAAPSVTLRTPEGESVTVKVRDPAKLDRVAVGDLVEITYTQAVAIAVTPAN